MTRSPLNRNCNRVGAMTPPERLQYHLDLAVKDENGCLNYPTKRKCGRPYVTYNYQRMPLARLIYQLTHNETIDKDLCVLHSCDNRRCINPEHLSLGTHKENTREAVARGRMHFGARSNKSHLTDADVLRIRELLEAGYTTIKLASDYKVSNGTISCIKRRQTWTHI